MNTQLYCVLIALNGDTLLLPNAVVAETVGQDALIRRDHHAHWHLGALEWNRQSVPALCFEVLNGAATQPLVKRSRLVVLHALSNPLDADSTVAPFALLSQGYPHLITVTRDALQPLPLRADDDPALVLTRVRIGSSEALIPDLDALSVLLKQP